MPALKQNSSSAAVAMPRPVQRALQRLGQAVSTARRVRQLSQGDLALRIGTSLSTVKRMEDGSPGTALHTFLRALHVLGRLDDAVQVMAAESDVLGLELMHEQLPKRVRKSSNGNARNEGQESVDEGRAGPSDELEGF